MGSPSVAAGLIKFLSQMIMTVVTTVYSLKEIVRSNGFRNFHEISASLFVFPGMVKPFAFPIGTKLEAAGD